MASFPLPMRRRSAIERRVLSMLRVEPTELAPYLKRLDAAQPRSRRYVIPKRDDCIEIIGALRRALTRRGVNLLGPTSQYVSQDEAHLLNWLAEAQRVVPRYQAPSDPELRSAIRLCAEMFDAHGHRLSLGPMLDSRSAPDSFSRVNGAAAKHLGERANGHDRMRTGSESPEDDRLPLRARSVSLPPGRTISGSAGSSLSDLLLTLIAAAGCNRIAAPADVPDDPSLLDGFAAMQAASARFDVLPGLPLTDHLWTHHSHLRNGDIAARLMESSRRAASLKLEGAVQGFHPALLDLCALSLALRPKTVAVPREGPRRWHVRVGRALHRSRPMRARARREGGGGPGICAANLSRPPARAGSVRTGTRRAARSREAAGRARRPRRGLRDRAAYRGWRGGWCGDILVTAGRAGERAQQLRITVSPATADDAGRPEIDFVVTPARWSDGSFVAWLDRAIVR